MSFGLSAGTIALIGAGAAVGGSLIAADAAGDAAETQAGAARDSNALQKYVFDKQVALQQPFYDNGLAAQNQLAQLITGGGLNTQFKFDTADLYNDPSYAFRLAEGQKAVERSAAARGITASGAQLKALTNYGQQAASQEYGNAYNRAQNTFNQNLNNRLNPLQSLAGQGQTTAGAIGQAAANYGNNVGNTLTGLANAQAASGIAGANALSGGLSGATGGYQQNMLLNRLLGGGSAVQPSWLAAANSSSDPIGSLNASAGWTY